MAESCSYAYTNEHLAAGGAHLEHILVVSHGFVMAHRFGNPSLAPVNPSIPAMFRWTPVSCLTLSSADIASKTPSHW